MAWRRSRCSTWTGSDWVDVPGGNVTGNNLVWRKLTFSPISTDRIRVLVNAALGSYSRIAEVEAWTAAAGGNAHPTVNLTSPPNNTTLAAPATVNLSANAADTDGTISKVEFYRDTTLIQTVTSPELGHHQLGHLDLQRHQRRDWQLQLHRQGVRQPERCHHFDAGGDGECDCASGLR